MSFYGFVLWREVGFCLCFGLNFFSLCVVILTWIDLRVPSDVIWCCLVVGWLVLGEVLVEPVFPDCFSIGEALICLDFLSTLACLKAGQPQKKLGGVRSPAIRACGLVVLSSMLVLDEAFLIWMLTGAYRASVLSWMRCGRIAGTCNTELEEECRCSLGASSSRGGHSLAVDPRNGGWLGRSESCFLPSLDDPLRTDSDGIDELLIGDIILDPKDNSAM